MDDAMNELTFVATGIYGAPLWSRFGWIPATVSRLLSSTAMRNMLPLSTPMNPVLRRRY